MSQTEGKPISCRAAVAWEASKPLVKETIEVAPPKAGEVRIKMVASGVCHSDWTYLKGYYKNDAFPAVMGHEGGGIVESVGEGVTTVKPGDHVIPTWITNCGDCSYCRNPKTNLCCSDVVDMGAMPDGTTRFTCRGKPVFHYHGIGTASFSEYSVLPEIAVVKIDENVPLDKACLLGCCVTTGYGAAVNTAKVEPGSTTAVWGLGGVGLAAVMGCKSAGASKIIGIDIKPEKFATARDLGCTECLNPKDYNKPIQQVLSEITGEGVDYMFECIGKVETMQQAFQASHVAWGTTVIVGIVGANQELILNPLQFLYGRTVKGSKLGGYIGWEGIQELSQEYIAGRLKLEKLVTHTMSLDKINEAFDLMLTGESIRTVIRF